MRIKVGFFTATHPEIDKELKRQCACNVVLWAHTYNASDVAAAMLKAKMDVPVDEIEREAKRRHPLSKCVGYTSQIKRKTAARSWMRSFSSISFEDLRRIQRDALAWAEEIISRR